MAILLINGFFLNHDFSKFDLNYFKQVLGSIAPEFNKKPEKKTIIKRKPENLEQKFATSLDWR